jgi:hypothetical protein
VVLRGCQYDYQSSVSNPALFEIMTKQRQRNNETAAIAGQQLRKYAVYRQRPTSNNGSSIGSGVLYVVRSEVISLDRQSSVQLIPCGGEVEYLHRSPASRRRRRKRKSRIWDSKIWSRVPKDSDPRMTALARTSSNCKRQTRPLVRDSATHQQTRNFLTVIKIWS